MSARPQTAPSANAIYRVDKFAVPAPAREEFLERVSATHALLRQQAGFLGDIILEQASGPGEFNFVTMVEWEGPEAIARAGEAVARMHSETGFDRHEMMDRLGIRADIANYQSLAV
ncbi:antibiotic biosynthesis monooxygenase [Nitratireductor rhodophyticola]|uniref:antibiotic biosynthesis monooxygenase n=1 Tax=Nitratireductor rhodophyticola TaxID=2854036 RepID=UPI0008141A13|nr:antibiotic biosynthesis monooxygenase [Nitratireductor rhodophyticola]MEC9244191.1 antibiotic biosynthesis monooxygenase [Pseudomonadota bacterium]WPZ12867.1 antibiotic biosynthesis monooxygenase [Nitratireductor rhodophyticola]